MTFRQEYANASFFFEGLTGSPAHEELIHKVQDFIATENLYLAANREVETKLQNLNNEFHYTKERNPIHSIHTRIKAPLSIIQKLQKRGLDLTVQSARENLTDIAGVRVICSYIEDIYLVANMLVSQDDVELVRTSDYIRDPKPNGYRSLHHIVKIPVFLSNRKEKVNVEIQFRTIAMDYWASLEHDLNYKLSKEKTVSIDRELKEVAEEMAQIDERMQALYNVVLKDMDTRK